MTKKYHIGYTQGTFDMFHIGHLNIIKSASSLCDLLIVGVNSDELVQKYKFKKPIIEESNRAEIVRNIKGVDDVIVCNSLDKIKIWNAIHFDAIFIGDDWKGNNRWKETEYELKKVGAKVVYLPHTNGISSTILREKMLLNK